MSTTEQPLDLMAAFARIFGPPRPLPPEPAEDRQRRLAEEDAAALRADAAELGRYFDGLALDARDDRVVRGYVRGAA